MKIEIMKYKSHYCEIKSHKLVLKVINIRYKVKYLIESHTYLI